MSYIIWRDPPGVGAGLGPDSPARRILACVYVTIGGISAFALALLAMDKTEAPSAIAAPLFSLQILYKIMTGPAVGLKNPIVVTNFCIVALLGMTLATEL